MSARIIDGRKWAAEIRAAAKEEVQRLAARGVHAGLAVVLAGDDPASRAYVRTKARACEETGLRSELHEFPAGIAERALLDRIAALNRDPLVHGILVQLPLPKPLNAARVLESVSPQKDVDGFHPLNLGALLSGQPLFVPCTPAGVMRLLEREGVELAGSRAVVLGRSNIVGKPMALLLLQQDATVTVCHSKTPRLGELTRQADVLVAAAGRAGLVTAQMVKPGACVIDVGINRLADGTLAGDAEFGSVKEVAGLLSPVPGGVGPMTVAMLISNTLQAAARSCSG